MASRFELSPPSLIQSESSDVEEIKRDVVLPECTLRHWNNRKRKNEVIIDGKPWYAMACDIQLPASSPQGPKTVSGFSKVASLLRLENSPPRSPLTESGERRKKLFFFDNDERIMIETVAADWRTGGDTEWWAAIGEAEAEDELAGHPPAKRHNLRSRAKTQNTTSPRTEPKKTRVKKPLNRQVKRGQ